MKVAAIALTAVAFAAAGSAYAASRATDLDYLKASRCKGIATSVGQVDTTGLDAYLKAEGRTRAPVVLERAAAETERAKREGRSVDRRERLTAELTNACTAYMGPAKDVAVR